MSGGLADEILEQDAANQREEGLKKSLRDALRRLEQSRVAKAELVQAVYQAAKDGIAAIDIQPVQAPKPDTRKGSEIAIAVLSDFQLAKVTPTYSTAACKKRVEAYGEKLIKLTEIQRADHPVKELRVWLLGDIVEGELIFAGQAHLIDASLYRQVTIDGPQILIGFLRRMLAHFETVKVVGVIGNHGSLGGQARREYRPESNADRMLYRIVQLALAEEKRITWEIPDGEGERNWYHVDYIGKHGFLLCHGDQFRWGIKTPSAEQKVLGWRTGAIPEPFTEVVCGHWHSLNLITLKGGTTTLRCNGSTESYNTYAQEHIGSMSRPGQWLLFAHEKHGVTAEYRVWLD